MVTFKSEKVVGERFREDDCSEEEPEDFTQAVTLRFRGEGAEGEDKNKKVFTPKVSPLEYIQDMERRSYFFRRLKDF